MTPDSTDLQQRWQQLLANAQAWSTGAGVLYPTIGADQAFFGANFIPFEAAYPDWRSTAFGRYIQAPLGTVLSDIQTPGSALWSRLVVEGGRARVTDEGVRFDTPTASAVRQGVSAPADWVQPAVAVAAGLGLLWAWS